MITRYLRSDTVPFDDPHRKVSRNEFCHYTMELMQQNPGRYHLITPFCTGIADLMEASNFEVLKQKLVTTGDHASKVALNFSVREFVPIVEFISGTLRHIKNERRIDLDDDYIEQASALTAERKELLYALNWSIEDIVNVKTWAEARDRLSALEEEMKENKTEIHPQEAICLFAPYYFRV